MISSPLSAIGARVGSGINGQTAPSRLRELDDVKPHQRTAADLHETSFAQFTKGNGRESQRTDKS